MHFQLELAAQVCAHYPGPRWLVFLYIMANAFTMDCLVCTYCVRIVSYTEGNNVSSIYLSLRKCFDKRNPCHIICGGFLTHNPSLT
jgi:hypothetical protein